MVKGPIVTSGHQLKDAPQIGSQSEKTVEEVVTSKEVALPQKASVPADKFFVSEEMEALGSAGLENVSTKNTILPRLTILQTLSDQLKPKKAEFIPGAQVGDWCDVSVGEIFRGDIEAIPCHFATQYIQWKKNRGGFAGNLGMDASCLAETTLNEKRQNILPNGDMIQETATWYILLRVGYDWRRVFLPFSSTGLKTSRKWMTLITAEKVFGKRGWFTPPLFYRPWTLKVLEESNDQGEWFTASPMRTPKEPEDITEAAPDKNKTIYDVMREMGDTDKYLLHEARAFYEDAKNELVVGDMSQTDDPNNADNALRSGAAIDNRSTAM